MNAHRRRREGDGAEDRGGGDDGDVEERQCYADGGFIDVGGDRQGEEGEGGEGAPLLGVAPVPQTFDDHGAADDGEKPEGDPVVPFGHDLAEIGPETPSQHGKE